MNDTSNPLHDKETERVILGTMLVDSAVIPRISPILGETSDTFFTVAHRMIYEAIIAVYDANQKVDAVMVGQHLNARGELERIGDHMELYDLQARIVETDNAEFHAQILREKAIRRQLVQTGKHISEIAHEQDANLEHVIDDAQQSVLELGKIQNKKGFANISGVLNANIVEMERLAREGIETPGLATGFTELDRLTTGMHPGELFVIAARPNMGKTSFALNVTLNVALEKSTNDAVGFFSLEMPSRQLALRMLASETAIPMTRLRTGDIKDVEWSTLTEVASILMENAARIHLCDNFGVTIGAIRQEARSLKARVDNLSLIIVDYLQRVKTTGSHGNREQEVAAISSELKELAGELEIPIIACAQLNRGLEHRPDKKPILSDLRESGAIEQDADFVGFLHSESDLSKEETAEIDLLVRKQRNGATGDVLLKFYAPIMRFANIGTGGE